MQKIFVKLKRIDKNLRNWIRKIRFLSCIPLYYVFRLFPLKNIVVATSFRGKIYGDNPMYIVEEMHKMDPSLKIVWIKNKSYGVSTPDFLKVIHFYSYFKKTLAMATAKVWIDSNLLESNIRKRKGQLFIETWHGGLGVKKIGIDVLHDSTEKKEYALTNRLADVFLSNSDFLTKIYRNDFHYRGKVWKVGFPKNDGMTDKAKAAARIKIRRDFKLNSSVRIFLYAPTFRDTLENKTLEKMARMDWEKIHDTLKEKWNGEWKIVVRWHPRLKLLGQSMKSPDERILDATQYPDMQTLLLGCDAFLSDYSSAIFDAALTGIPCFTLASDFETYKAERGVYYEMEELPFPYAKTLDELALNIRDFDEENFGKKWATFKKETGLVETTHAGRDVAQMILDFLKGKSPQERLHYEP